MKHKVLAAMVVLGLGIVALAGAQAPPAPPKPGPEHKRLGYFVGRWTATADMKPSPFGPGGKATFKENCEWFSGGFSVVCRSEGSGPMGQVKGIALMAYSAEEKTYEYHAVNSQGFVEFSRGTVKGSDWNWNSQSKMGGKPVKSRFTIKELSATSYSFKFEMSTGGGPWTVVMEGKSNKGK